MPQPIIERDQQSIKKADRAHPVLDIPIRVGEPMNSPHLPSLDRVAPHKGYTRDNVRVISLRANMLKKDADLEELEALVRYVRKALGRNRP